MSQANVAIVHRIYDSYARHESETPFEFYAPDIEWDLSVHEMGGVGATDIYHGHDGVRESFRDTLKSFREYEAWIEEDFDAGDRVLVAVHERAVGRVSDVPLERHHYALWTFDHGKVSSTRVYRDRSEAMKAAGLED